MEHTTGAPEQDLTGDLSAKPSSTERRASTNRESYWILLLPAVLVLPLENCSGENVAVKTYSFQISEAPRFCTAVRVRH